MTTYELQLEIMHPDANTSFSNCREAVSTLVNDLMRPVFHWLVSAPKMFEYPKSMMIMIDFKSHNEKCDLMTGICKLDGVAQLITNLTGLDCSYSIINTRDGTQIKDGYSNQE